MVKLKLLDNGIDSLRKGIEALIKYEQESNTNKKATYIKDSIVFLHHGTEILIKYIIYRENEFLIFSEINENVIKAYKQKLQQNKKSIFETELIDKLHTINFETALERVTVLLNHSMDDKLYKKLKLLNKLRNRIIHSEMFISKIEFLDFFPEFIDYLNNYFSDILKHEYATAIGYKDLMQEVDKVKDYLKENKKEYLIKVYEIFSNKFKENNSSIKAKDLRVISDLNFAYRILNSLIENDIELNGYLYDEISLDKISKLERDKKHLKLFCEGNEGIYTFKFKKMLLCLPSVESLNGPTIWIESDIDNINDEKNISIRKVSDMNIKYFDFMNSDKNDGFAEMNYLTKGIAVKITVHTFDKQFIMPSEIAKLSIDDLYESLRRKLR